MSKFRTTIPVPFEELTRRLPDGSAVTAVTLSKDRRSVEVLWEHDDLKTPLTVPVDWPDLAEVPAEVRLLKPGVLSGQKTNSPSREETAGADARARRSKK